MAALTLANFLRLYSTRRALVECRTLVKTSKSSKQFSTTSQNRNASTDEIQDYEDLLAEEEEASTLKRLQNVSGLTTEQFDKYHGRPPKLPYESLKMKRQLYAKYGSKSGCDPRFLWPTREELLDQDMEEKEETEPLHDRIARLESQKMQELKEKRERRQMIEQNMSRMSGWIQEYRHKLVQAEEVVKTKQEKREALLEEARDYFGYKVRANDPKFQQMVEEKEELERKEAKKRKKEAKNKMAAAAMERDLKAMGLHPSDTTASKS